MAKKATTEHLEMAQQLTEWAKKHYAHNDLTSLDTSQ
jgi:hypothetical protein